MLLLLCAATSVSAQAVRPAYGGRLADWNTVPGWFDNPQAFCAASLANLQAEFGQRVWFKYPGTPFDKYMPDRFDVSITPPEYGSSFTGACIGVYDDYGPPGEYVLNVAFAPVWLCPAGTARVGNDSASWGPGRYNNIAPYSNLYVADRYLSSSTVYCTASQPLYFLRSIPTPQAQCDSCNGNSVGHPINPANGAVFDIANDVDTKQLVVPFKRFYNSADVSRTNMSSGWRGSFTRSVKGIIYPSTLHAFDSNDPDNSSLYTDPATACLSGFAQIQSRVANWAGATVQYVDGICQLVKNGLVVDSIPLHHDAGVPLASPTPQSYEVNRDDGQLIRFWSQSGSLRSGAGVSLRLTQTASGFELRDGSDNIEVYDDSGVLQTVTSRAGVTQTMSYDTTARLSTVTDSFGHRLVFSYDTQNRLQSVMRQ